MEEFNPNNQNYVLTNKYNPVLSKVYTLKPNKAKLIFSTGLTLLIYLAIVIGIIILLNKYVSLDVFFEGLQAIININITAADLIKFVIYIFIFVIIVSIIGNFIAGANIKYEFYRDKFVMYTNAALIFVNKKEISYQNINNVSYTNNGIFDKLFNCGKIIFELRGMKESKVVLDYIDDVEQTTKDIESLIKQDIFTQITQFQQNNRVENIMSRY